MGKFYEVEMSMEEIREFGKAIGILSVAKFNHKKDLIRTIQLAEGKVDCFAMNVECNRTNCIWAADCAQER